jgi:predicted solute-binding protein
MFDGELDLALLPVIELARMPELELVPGLGIVTRGASRSVLLVGKTPPTAIRTLALDPESRTSNVLSQVLLARVWNCRPTCFAGPLELARALEGADAVVRIGDKALFEPLPAGLHVHDLGTVWTETTGLPFVFAAWAARPGVVDRELYALLHASRREGTRAIDLIAETYDWNGQRHPDVARAYLREHILFRFGSAELEALELFLRAAHELALIDRLPPIRLALRRRTTCDETAARLESAPQRGS